MTQANSGSATERTPGTGDASAYAPLRRPIFRALWIASLASNLGTWLQNVGAGWLMTSLTPSPLMVALVQAATTLPVFLLAIPAGALADVIDRRRLLLAAQGWMLAAAASVAAVTAAGVVTPWLLLALTFALGLGFALNAPAWQAVVPEVVPRAEVPAAVALNGVSMNASRAVGPALGGVLVAAAGPEAAFLLNALSFLVVVWVLFRWDRPAAAGALPAERLVGAMRAGVRYVRHAPAFRAVLVRAAAFVSGAAGLWALLPAVARDHADWGPAAYGVMLGSLGVGAVLGTLLLPAVRRGTSADVVAAGGTILFAACSAGVALLPILWARCLLLFPAGAAWLAVLTALNSSAQSLLPAWVRARALSVYLLVFFGGMAAGSVLWGVVAGPLGVPLALLASAGWMVVSLTAGLRYRLPAGPLPAVEPSRHWPDAPAVPAAEYERGPVLVTVEYRVPADSVADFRAAAGLLRGIRLRDGAIRWDLFQDVEDAERFVEVFLVESWVEHLRQHERLTDEDWAHAAAIRALHAGDHPPRVTHLIAAGPARTA
ncbi:MAG TPA: MFS transporter [Gemmataceae bacterium]|nr:MFS transporter [Gemmataceae bacterium]